MNFVKTLIAGVALAAAAFVPAQTFDDKPEAKQEVLQRLNRIIDRSAFVPGVDFKKWPEFLAAQQAQIDAAKTDEEFANAINAALQKFGLSHIVLHTPRMADMRRTNSIVGIGISHQPVEGGIMIVRVIPDAPAAKAGLRAGDTILKVDGKPTQGAAGIAGPEGTTVVLTVKRSDGTEKEFSLTRARFSTKWPEELTWLDETKETAMLTVRTFDFSYDRQNVANLMKEAAGAKNLVLDLRANPGGAVINLQHLLGLLMPEEEVVGTFINRGMLSAYQTSTGKDGKDLTDVAKWSVSPRWDPLRVTPIAGPAAEPFKGNIAVLINGASGSASEIVAAALKDHRGAKLVGTKTAGAVLASLIVPLVHNFQLQYPIQDYVTTKGVRLEGNGVAPDVVSDVRRALLPGDKDDTIVKAVEILKTTAGGH